MASEEVVIRIKLEGAAGTATTVSTGAGGGARPPREPTEGGGARGGKSDLDQLLTKIADLFGPIGRIALSLFQAIQNLGRVSAPQKLTTPRAAVPKPRAPRVPRPPGASHLSAQVANIRVQQANILVQRATVVIAQPSVPGTGGPGGAPSGPSPPGPPRLPPGRPPLPPDRLLPGPGQPPAPIQPQVIYPRRIPPQLGGPRARPVKATVLPEPPTAGKFPPPATIPSAAPAEGPAAAVAAGATRLAGALTSAATIAAAAVALNVALNAAMARTIEGLGRLAAASVRAGTDIPTPLNEVGDLMKTIGFVTGGFSALFGVIGLPGVALGALTVAIGATTKAFASLLQALDETVARYAEVTPQVAVAQALADVQMMMGDMRRGQLIAPEMVNYIEARTELQQRIEDIKVQFMKQLLPIATQGIQFLQGALDKGGEILEAMLEMGSHIPGIRDWVNQIRQNIQAMRDAAQETGLELPTWAILAQQAPAMGEIFDSPGPAGRGEGARPGP